MREIKFRAWDKDKKIFVTAKNCYLNLADGWVYNQIKDDGYYNLELMQYTGLKDNNGTEIYEGDLHSSDKGLYKVNYYLSQFVLDRIIKRTNETHNSLFLSDWYDQGEVIGNIYEHPNLLKEDSQ